MKVRTEKKPIQLVFGSAFHLGIEAYYEDKDPVKVFKRKFKFTEISFPEKKSKADEGKTNQQIFDENYDAGVNLMKYWRENATQIHQQHKITKKGKSEVKFKSQWRDPFTGEKLNTKIHGRFDRITSDGVILEFKTSKKPYTESKVKTEIQPDVYTFTYHTKMKEPCKRFIYIVFIKGRKENPVQVLEVTRSEEDFAMIFDKAEKILQRCKDLNASNYKYGTGFLHKYCDCKKYEELLYD